MIAEIYCHRTWIPYPTPGNDTQCSVCKSVFHVTTEQPGLMPLDAIVDEPVETVLGQDDWAFYARTKTGRLVYFMSELYGHWLDAPHKGECWNSDTGKNCLGETTFVCRIDCAWMLLHMINHKDDLTWQNAEGVEFHPGPYVTFIDDVKTVDYSHMDFNEAMGWPPEKDAEFMAESRKNHLID